MVSASEFLKWLNVFNVQTGSRPGTVSSVGTGTGLTGGTITTTGTISFAAIPAGTIWANITGGSAVPTTVTLASILAPYLPLAGGTMTGALNMGGFALSNLATPTAATDACTKQYADNIAAGLNPTAAVVGASTANLTGWVYNNGTAGVGATLTAPSIGVFAPDGVTLNVGDRWLYKNDTTGGGAYNGIYSITVNNAGAQAVITRWSGYDTPTDIQKGDLTAVDFGTSNADSSYLLTSQPAAIGTDPLTYSAFFTPATYLQVANNLSDLNSTSTARTNLGVPSTTGTGATGTWNISILGNAATATSASSASSVPVGGITGLGTGVATALGINVGSAGAFVVNGGALGTPASGNLSNCTGVVASGALLNVQVVSAGGAFTYTPTQGMATVIVEAVGGGAGSGGTSGTGSTVACSGGGGGGAYAKFRLTAAQVGASLSGVLGTGGAGGVAGNNNGTGGNNSTLATASPWTLAGGSGGQGMAGQSGGSSASAAGGNGGAVTAGTGTVILSIDGQKGGSGGVSTTGGGVSPQVGAGKGGDSGMGLGGAALYAAPTQGIAPTGYGAGGGGTTSNTNTAGRGGSDGRFIFWEYS